LHTHNYERKIEVQKKLPKAKVVFVADLSDMQQSITMAHELRECVSFDAVIHNAGVYKANRRELLTVNVLAPLLQASSLVVRRFGKTLNIKTK
jgi:NADP-dependent 3-hydroxy acid dehydrogenase YdfG